MSRFVLAAGLFAGWVTGAAAQPLTPLSDYLALPADRRVSTYPAIRCAGLYFGVIDYGGATMGPDALSQTQESARTLVLFATVMRMREQGGDLEPHLRNAMATVDRIARLYRERMEANFASAGQAWGSDPLIISDLLTCRAVLQVAQ